MRLKSAAVLMPATLPEDNRVSARCPGSTGPRKDEFSEREEVAVCFI